MRSNTRQAIGSKWARYAACLALIVIATSLGASADNAPVTTYPEGMVAYWKFDGNLRDELGNYPARMGSYGSYATGLINQGLHGAPGCSNPYAAQVDGFPNLHSFTIEAWIKPPCSSSQGSLTINKLKDYGGGFIFYTVPIPYGSGDYSFFLGLYDQQSRSISTPHREAGQRTFPCNRWYHVVATRDFGVALRIFVNGEEYASRADDGRDISNNELLSFHGWSSGGCGWGMNSITMDEVAMYDRVLTPTEIENHYEQGLQGLGYEILTPPLEITCPPDVTALECGQPTDPDATGWATATPEDPVPTITYEDAEAAGVCPQKHIITRTWTATDPTDDSRTASCVQTITVVDTTPPAITLNGDAELTLECNYETYAEAGATVVDACEGALQAQIGGDVVDVSRCGTYVVTYGATDGCGNAASAVTRTVHVVDTTPPDLTCPADITAEATGASGAVVSFVATATDAVTAVPTLTYSPASGSTFPLGTTTVTVTATDAAGNPSSCSFTVTVRDTTAPTISSVTVSPSSLWPPNGKMNAITVTAASSDAVDPAPVCRVTSVTCDEDASGDFELGGGLAVSLRAERDGKGDGRVYTLHVECADAAGNAAQGTVTVTVPHDQGKSKGK